MYYNRKTYHSNDPRWITARFSSNCKCGNIIKKGDNTFYWPRTKDAQCSSCGEKSERRFLSEVWDEENNSCM